MLRRFLCFAAANLSFACATAGGRPGQPGSNPASSPPITIEWTFDMTANLTWRAWTHEADLASWLTGRAKVRAEVGGPYELFWDPEHPDRNSTLGCRLLEVIPLRRLSFTWRGPVQFADLMNAGEPPPTSVRVDFEAISSGRTRVRLEHVGWGAGERWQQARAWQEQAWRGAFDELERFASTRTIGQ
jgi:uncharacterized protein YndB with AHSA1/START domain